MSSLPHLGRNAPPGQEGLPRVTAGVSSPGHPPGCAAGGGGAPAWISRPCQPQPLPLWPTPAHNSCHQRRGARRGGKGCRGVGTLRGGMRGGGGGRRALQPRLATCHLPLSCIIGAEKLPLPPPKSLAFILSLGTQTQRRHTGPALSSGSQDSHCRPGTPGVLTMKDFILSAPPPDRGGALQGQYRPHKAAPLTMPAHRPPEPLGRQGSDRLFSVLPLQDAGGLAYSSLWQGASRVRQADVARTWGRHPGQGLPPAGTPGQGASGPPRGGGQRSWTRGPSPAAPTPHLAVSHAA